MRLSYDIIYSRGSRQSAYPFLFWGSFQQGEGGAQLGPRHNSNTNDMTRTLHFIVLPLSESGLEEFSLFFFDVKQCSVLCWDGKLRFAVLPPSKPSWDEFGLSCCDVNQFNAFYWGCSVFPFTVLMLS